MKVFLVLLMILSSAWAQTENSSPDSTQNSETNSKKQEDTMKSTQSAPAQSPAIEKQEETETGPYNKEGEFQFWGPEERKERDEESSP